MAVYLEIDGGEPAQLATTEGYSKLGEWIESLPPKQFPRLIALWESGECDEPAELSEELETAASDHPAKDKNVDKTLDGFVELIGSVGDAEHVVISNGIS